MSKHLENVDEKILIFMNVEIEKNHKKQHVVRHDTGPKSIFLHQFILEVVFWCKNAPFTFSLPILCLCVPGEIVYLFILFTQGFKRFSWLTADVVFMKKLGGDLSNCREVISIMSYHISILFIESLYRWPVRWSSMGQTFFSWGRFIHKDWWFRGFVFEKSILEIDHMNPNIPFNCTASPCRGVILYGDLLKGSKPIWQILILVNSVNWNTLIPRVYVG